MISLEEIKDIVTDDKINSFFIKRDEDLNTFTKEQQKQRLEIVKEYKVNYDSVLRAIDNIPPCFEETRKNIIQAIKNYLEKERILQTYDNERFYKTGFCDAIGFIIEGKNNNNTRENRKKTLGCYKNFKK